MNGNRLLLLLFVGLLTLSVKAQRYFFRAYGPENGISVSTINDLEQDTLGFIWVATEGGGLLRFDGINSTPWTEENGLPSDYVSTIYQLKDGRFLIGTEKGAAVFDGQHLTDVNLGKDSRQRVLAMLERKDAWYFLFRHELIRYHPKNKTVDHIQFSTINERTCFLPKTDDVWYVGSDDGLWEINLNSGKSELIWNVDGVTSLFKDADGLIWIGGNKGIYTKKQDFISQKVLPFSFTDVRSIVQEKSGVIWLGSRNEGLVQFKGDKFTHINVNNGLNTPRVRSIHIDLNNRIWVGSLSGLSTLMHSNLVFYGKQEGLLDEHVHAVHRDYFGKIWLGTIRGLSMIDQGKVTNYGQEAGFPEGLVFDLMEDLDGVLWGATEKGLISFKNDKFKAYDDVDELKNAFIFDLEQESGYLKYIATATGLFVNSPKGIAKANPEIWPQEGFIEVKKHKDNLYALSLTGAFYIQKGNAKAEIFQLPGIASDSISISTFGVLDSVLVFGTNGQGVYIYDYNTVYHLDEADGLISKNIWSLALSYDAGIWVGSESGFQHIAKRENAYVPGMQIASDLGYYGVECNAQASFADPHNAWIAFGTNSGVQCFSFEDNVLRKAPGKIRITGLDVFFQPFDASSMDGISLMPWTAVPVHPHLDYDQNYLTIKYAALGVDDPSLLKFEYILEGRDKQWTPADDRMEAQLTSLTPGKYTFRVRAFDPTTGTLLEEASYLFVIRSPFWKTWYFILLMTLALSSIVVYTIRERIRRANEKLQMQAEFDDLERRALRLQMNPHFVFNALDSISGFIFQNDARSAVKYLNNFAKLMRLTLESSREHFVPLHTEVQLLENYLALEQLRFSHQFTFTITLEDDLDAYAIMLPSMMIQPHVENAILHGIRPKEGEGHIELYIALDGDDLIVEIKDDGVGRERAAEIAKKSGRDHRSLAGEISRSRLKLYERTMKGHYSMEVEDLKDSNNRPLGTLVRLRLPIQNSEDWN